MAFVEHILFALLLRERNYPALINNKTTKTNKCNLENRYFISSCPDVGNARMDENTEALAESILTGCVPAKWMSKSYPSLKSFANYINDLKLRIEFWQVRFH